MKLRTGIVGGGTVSAVHIDGLKRNPRTDLVAICDVDEERARELAEKHEIRPFTSVQTMVDEVDLDWVHVCTPVQTHVDVALTAIEAGIPVMIEKPITETVAEFERLAEAARAHDVPVSVKHNHVFDPAMRKAMDRVQSGDLGRVKGVDVIYTGSSRPDDPNRGAWSFDLAGGEFEEGLAHPIYLTLRAGGYPEDADDVLATTTTFEEYDRPFAYDAAQLQYVSRDGVLCTTKMLGDTIPVRQVLIHGRDLSLTVDLISQTLVEHDRDYKASAVARAQNNVDQVADRIRGTIQNGGAVIKRAMNDDWDVARKLNAHFYQNDAESRALITDSPMPVPLEEGRWTVQLMETIRESAGRNAADEGAADAEPESPPGAVEQ